MTDLRVTRRRSSCARWVPGEAAAERAASDLRLDARRAAGERARPVTPAAAAATTSTSSSRTAAAKRKRADAASGAAAAPAWSRRTLAIVVVADRRRRRSASAPAPRSRRAATSTRCGPVEIGQNSFVYADDGSLLGSIPAERNREPVTTQRRCRSGCRGRRSRSRTAASTQHGGVDYVGIARAAWKDVTRGQGRRGRLDDHAAARAQPLHRPGEDVQRARSRRRASRSSSRSKWPKQQILDEYLNTVYYGNHAYGVEAAAQTYFSKHASQLTLLAVGAARRAAAGAVGLRPVPQPAGRARPARRGAARDARRTDDDHARAVPTARSARTRSG